MSCHLSKFFTLFLAATLAPTMIGGGRIGFPQSEVLAGNNLTSTPVEIAQHHHNTMQHNMSLGPADTEYDLRFLDGMMLHHQGALEMAQEALNKSKRPEMKSLAKEIINAQKKEIAQMQKWRQAWYPKASSTPIAWHSEMNHSMPMTKQQKQSMMMSMDLGKADTKFDLRFLNGMIPHHQGALEMAQDALRKSQRPEIKQLAQDILTSQQKEIDQMKQWKKAWYGK